MDHKIKRKTGTSDPRLHGGVLEMWRFSHKYRSVVARVHKGMMALMYYGMDDLFGVFLFAVMWLSFLLSFLVLFLSFCFHLI